MALMVLAGIMSAVVMTEPKRRLKYNKEEKKRKNKSKNIMGNLRSEILEHVSAAPDATPFFAGEVKALFPNTRGTTVDKALFDLVESDELRRYAKGIYYKPWFWPGTTFDMGCDTTTLIEKLWLAPDEGYASGAMYANEMGLQTVLPVKIDIFTNKWRVRRGLADKLNVRLHKPKITVNSENKDILKLLDAVKDDTAFDAPTAPLLLATEIDRLSLNKLELYETAEKHYPKKVREYVAKACLSA